MLASSSATLHSHTASSLSVLGRPGEVRDIPRVDQPRIQTLGLQQVKHRFPVVRGGLHHHPADPQTPQMISHRQQRPSHRGVAHHLLTAPPRLVLMRNPDITHQLSLTDIQRRHPRDDLSILWIFLQHRVLPTVNTTQPAAARGSCQGSGESDPRARSDTERPIGAAPNARLMDDLNPVSASRNHDVSGQPSPFSARNGPPARERGDCQAHRCRQLSGARAR